VVRQCGRINPKYPWARALFIPPVFLDAVDYELNFIIMRKKRANKRNSKATDVQLNESKPNPDLFTAYQNTLYIVYGLKKPISIGVDNQEVKDFLKNHNCTTWAFITAYNPMSEQLSEKENAERNALLETLIQKYTYLKGEGKAIAGDWPPEPSYFIAGITKKDSIVLARKFLQRAIVYGTIKSVPQLIETIKVLTNKQ